MKFKLRYLLLLGYPILGYAIWEFVKYGLHPDDRINGRR